jgi:ankyrin repeat protein
MTSAAHHAAFYGYAQVLEFLCYYFDVFVPDDQGRTPMWYAALRNNLDCVVLLVSMDARWLDVGDSRGDTPLHASTFANGRETLRFLLSCEANPDIANIEGLTPSHLARTPDALEALYNAGATAYCVDEHSRIPLWLACKNGLAEV